MCGAAGVGRRCRAWAGPVCLQSSDFIGEPHYSLLYSPWLSHTLLFWFPTLTYTPGLKVLPFQVRKGRIGVYTESHQYQNRVSAFFNVFNPTPRTSCLSLVQVSLIVTTGNLDKHTQRSFVVKCFNWLGEVGLLPV